MRIVGADKAFAVGHNSPALLLENFLSSFERAVAAFFEIGVWEDGDFNLRRDAGTVERLAVCSQKDLVGKAKTKTIRQTPAQHIGKYPLRVLADTNHRRTPPHECHCERLACAYRVAAGQQNGLPMEMRATAGAHKRVLGDSKPGPIAGCDQLGPLDQTDEEEQDDRPHRGRDQAADQAVCAQAQ